MAKLENIKFGTFLKWTIIFFLISNSIVVNLIFTNILYNKLSKIYFISCVYDIKQAILNNFALRYDEYENK